MGCGLQSMGMTRQVETLVKQRPEDARIGPTCQRRDPGSSPCLEDACASERRKPVGDSRRRAPELLEPYSTTTDPPP